MDAALQCGTVLGFACYPGFCSGFKSFFLLVVALFDCVGVLEIPVLPEVHEDGYFRPRLCAEDSLS